MSSARAVSLNDPVFADYESWIEIDESGVTATLHDGGKLRFPAHAPRVEFHQKNGERTTWR